MGRPLGILVTMTLGVGALAACSSGRTTNAQPVGDCPTPAIAVVVSVDQWGDIVNRLAGDCGDVTTIIKSSTSDPHGYEPTPADNAKFTGAKLVVVNGLDYDPWADKAVASLDTQPRVINGGDVIGLEAGDNPHIWYGPEFVKQVSDAVTAELKQLEPKAASYFDDRAAEWRTALEPYDAEIAKIKPLATRGTYGATEGIFDHMARALGLQNRTPRGYQTAAANASDPAPGDVNEFEQALASRKITVLISNTQTEGAIPEQVRTKAEQADVPVVDMTESVPPGLHGFVAWQVEQLEHLASALGA